MNSRAFEIYIRSNAASSGHGDSVGAFQPSLLDSIFLDFDLFQGVFAILLAVKLLLFGNLSVDLVRHNFVAVQILKILQAFLVCERLFGLRHHSFELADLVDTRINHVSRFLELVPHLMIFNRHLIGLVFFWTLV